MCDPWIWSFNWQAYFVWWLASTQEIITTRCTATSYGYGIGRKFDGL